MARVTHVKKAQQRYKTVPVIDPETGQQKVTPVLRKDGTPKMTRAKANRPARPITMKVTQSDKTRPLPPLNCEACGKPIEIGTPYKHVTPKSGPYGGRQRNRHEGCPNWKAWDLSNAWWARIAQVVEPALDDFDPDTPEDVTSQAEDIANQIRELAQESQESADNIEEGFGHPTSQSEEAAERADNLGSWADEIESVDVPDLPEPEEEDCDTCDATGEVDNPEYDAEKAEGGEDEEEGYAEDEKIECSECGGTGKVESDEPTEDQMNGWRDEAVQALQDLLDNSPL